MTQTEKSKKVLKAEEQVKRAQANLNKARREEKKKLRQEQDRHKYMMGGCVGKYFPEAFDFTEHEMNRIIIDYHDITYKKGRRFYGRRNEYCNTGGS